MDRPNPRLLDTLPLLCAEGLTPVDAHIEHSGAVAVAYGLTTAWSAGRVNFSEVAFLGVWRLRYGCHWGVSEIVSPAMLDPTWLDLFAAADWAIALSGDSHHTFIENFHPARHGFLHLSTGS